MEPHGHVFGLRVTKINDKEQFQKYNIQEYFDFIVDVLEKPSDFKIERDFLKFIMLNDNQ